jgi:hypothetical protein
MSEYRSACESPVGDQKVVDGLAEYSLADEGFGSRRKNLAVRADS